LAAQVLLERALRPMNHKALVALAAAVAVQIPVVRLAVVVVLVLHTAAVVVVVVLEPTQLASVARVAMARVVSPL
jgi:hypothetical protein